MLNKKFIEFIVTLVFCAVTSLALAEVPVVDYSSDAGSVKDVHPSASAPASQLASPRTQFDQQPEVVVQPAPEPESVASAQDASQPLAHRVNKMQQQINNLNQQNVGGRIEELERQIQKLTGQLEVQQHQIEQMNLQLRNFYQDLNQRIGKGAELGNVVLAPESKDLSGKSSVAANTSVAPESKEVDSISKKSVAAATTQAQADAASLKEQQLYQTAIDLLPDRKYDNSAAKLKVYIASYPQGAYIANAYYWLGEIYFLQKKFNLASNQFKIVMSKFATSKKVPDAALKLALIHDSQGLHQQAANELRQVKKRYPNTAAAQLATSQLQVMGKD